MSLHIHPFVKAAWESEMQSPIVCYVQSPAIVPDMYQAIAFNSFAAPSPPVHSIPLNRLPVPSLHGASSFTATCRFMFTAPWTGVARSAPVAGWQPRYKYLHGVPRPNAAVIRPAALCPGGVYKKAPPLATSCWLRSPDVNLAFRKSTS